MYLEHRALQTPALYQYISERSAAKLLVASSKAREDQRYEGRDYRVRAQLLIMRDYCAQLAILLARSSYKERAFLSRVKPHTFDGDAAVFNNMNGHTVGWPFGRLFVRTRALVSALFALGNTSTMVF